MDEKSLSMSVDLSMDNKSLAYDVNENNIPSATAVLNISVVKDKVDVVFQGEIFAHRTNFSFTSKETGNIAITMFCKNTPVFDLRCQLATISNTVEVLTRELIVPLPLVCHNTSAQKSATYKLSLDSSQNCLSIDQLFPEFPHENNQTTLGLQPYFSDIVVSIFVSNKTSRYRIQSNSTDFLFVVFSQLVDRIKAQQPDVRLHCPVPLHMFLGPISDFVEAENSRERMEREVGRIAVQMRQAETILVSKLKSDREAFTPHVSTLINHTYREMLSALDEMARLEATLNGDGRRSLRALLNLMAAVLELPSSLNGNGGGGDGEKNGDKEGDDAKPRGLPFDGSILDGTDQKLSDLIALFLQPEGGIAATTSATSTKDDEKDGGGKTYSADEISQIIVRYCERQQTGSGATIVGSKTVLTALSEADEEEEEMESRDEFLKREEEKDNNEFSQLRSGSMAVAHFSQTQS